jgi:sulfide:quinone oxidoreductase
VGQSIHQYYTLDGAVALYERLKSWEGGRMVVNIMEFPFKCPVAPLEFTFLADWWFREHGRRDKVEIVFATPMSEVFTKPVAARHLTGVLQSKDINVETDFYVERIDAGAGALVAYDGRELPYDLLVTVPVNMGAPVIARSGLGDELNHVPVDKGTFLSTKHPNIFALGDAAALPTSKAGSVAHFSVEVFAENFPRYAEGLEMLERFDGHANCFIESGFGKGLLIDFNYDTEPLPGKYPLPGIGPFSLLQETVTNHWGKMMFRWVYWNLLLRGREIPLPSEMSMYGKER